MQKPKDVSRLQVGARIWLGVIIISWGTVAAATAAVKDAHSFYICRFFLGLCEAGDLSVITFVQHQGLVYRILFVVGQCCRAMSVVLPVAT